MALWHAATITGSLCASRASDCISRSACNSSSSPLPTCAVTTKHSAAIGAAAASATRWRTAAIPSACSKAVQSNGQPRSKRTRQGGKPPRGASAALSNRAAHGVSVRKASVNGSCNAASARSTCSGASAVAHSSRWPRAAPRPGSNHGARLDGSRSSMRAAKTGRPAASRSSGSSDGRGAPLFAAESRSPADSPAAHARKAPSNCDVSPRWASSADRATGTALAAPTPMGVAPEARSACRATAPRQAHRRASAKPNTTSGSSTR